MSNSDSRSQIWHKFYEEFRGIPGVGLTKAERCADAALSVVDAVVKEQEIRTSATPDDPEHHFPWHLFDEAVGSRVTVITCEDEGDGYWNIDSSDGGHVCNVPECEVNNVDSERIPDQFKGVELELFRPSDV